MSHIRIELEQRIINKDGESYVMIGDRYTLMPLNLYIEGLKKLGAHSYNIQFDSGFTKENINPYYPFNKSGDTQPDLSKELSSCQIKQLNENSGN